MSEEQAPMPSEWELVRKAQARLDKEAADRARWERERQCDQSVKDIAALTLVVNALSAKVKDDCLTKSWLAKWSRPLKWVAGIAVTAIIGPLSILIFQSLTKIPISQ